MKSERRTLTDALKPQLTQEALALIKEGTPKPQTPAIVPAAPTTPVAVKPEEKPTAMVAREAPAEPVKSKALKEPEITAYVPLTVRVPISLPSALLKAASDRKLRKIKPYTQQDIVAEALQSWLRKQGYLSEQG